MGTKKCPMSYRSETPRRLHKWQTNEQDHILYESDGIFDWSILRLLSSTTICIKENQGSSSLRSLSLGDFSLDVLVIVNESLIGEIFDGVLDRRKYFKRGLSL